MKFTLLVLVLMVTISCGKNNESGKPSIERNFNPYTIQEEEAIKQDFLREGKEVLARYQDEIKEMFGPRTTGLIRGRLRHENVQLSPAILYGERNLVARSTNRNSMIILYIGTERPNLSWGPYRNTRPDFYSRLVLHELLLLGEIDDRNFVYTDQILRRR